MNAATAPFDPFYGSRAPTTPAQNGFAITPADYLPLPGQTRWLYIGGAGNVTVILRGDPLHGNSALSKQPSAITFYGVSAGTFLPVCAQCVMATGTTATNILGLV